jgi:hypothetical protein
MLRSYNKVKRAAKRERKPYSKHQENSELSSVLQDMVEPCCHNDCVQQISPNIIQNIRQQFTTQPSQEARHHYLAANMSIDDDSKHFKYYANHQVVCRTAFLHIFPISPDLLTTVHNEIKDNIQHIPRHSRGATQHAESFERAIGWLRLYLSSNFVNKKDDGCFELCYRINWSQLHRCMTEEWKDSFCDPPSYNTVGHLFISWHVHPPQKKQCQALLTPHGLSINKFS